MSLHLFTANRVALKIKILEAGIRKHQSVIDDFNLSIQEMLSSDGIVNEETIDLSQQEFNAELIQRANEIGEQLNFVNAEMKLLNDMIPGIRNIHNVVQLGSVVATDREIFFVSVSIERFQVDGLKIFGLSTESPLYKTMEGKQQGDTFIYKDVSYTIQELF